MLKWTTSRQSQIEMGSVMHLPMRKAVYLLAVATLFGSAHAQSPGPVTDTTEGHLIEGHLAAGKNAAGGRDNTPDFYGLVTAICVAPQHGAPAPDAPAPREDPNRKATPYAAEEGFR